MAEILKEAIKRVDKGEIIALVTVIEAKGSTPRETGAKVLVNSNGLVSGTIGGGALENKVIEEAKKAIKDKKGCTLSYHLSKEEASLDEWAICGGDIKVFIDVLQPKEELLIFGAGHIALCVSKLAKTVGFKVTVIDDRQEFANKERFPEADEIMIDLLENVFEKIKILPFSYIVIVTRGHLQDQKVLSHTIKSNAAYIGMIGSRKKNETVFQHLKEQGIAVQEFKKVHAPIGIDIGAQTPEEIAISIIAEIIKVKRNKNI